MAWAPQATQGNEPCRYSGQNGYLGIRQMSCASNVLYHLQHSCCVFMAWAVVCTQGNEPGMYCVSCLLGDVGSPRVYRMCHITDNTSLCAYRLDFHCVGHKYMAEFSGSANMYRWLYGLSRSQQLQLLGGWRSHSPTDTCFTYNQLLGYHTILPCCLRTWAIST